MLLYFFNIFFNCFSVIFSFLGFFCIDIYSDKLSEESPGSENEKLLINKIDRLKNSLQIIRHAFNKDEILANKIKSNEPRINRETMIKAIGAIEYFRKYDCEQTNTEHEQYIVKKKLKSR